MEERRSPRIITLFMSFNLHLRHWKNVGLLSREVALYKYLLAHDYLEQVQIFTYGFDDEKILEMVIKDETLRRKVVLLKPEKPLQNSFAALCFSLTAPFKFRQQLKQSWWLKTNQLSGSWSAILAKLITGRPLLTRFGYILSKRFNRDGKFLHKWLAIGLQYIAFAAARIISAPTNADIKFITPYVRNTQKMRKMPTYIDIKKFTPSGSLDFDTPVIFIGRLNEVKNLEALIDASCMINREVHLYGEGPLRTSLTKQIAETGAPVKLMGTLGNNDIAKVLQQYAVFVLCSKLEGLPKALLEAMSVGLVCVCTEVGGISEIITHEKNGYIIKDQSAEEIAKSLERALHEKRADLGTTAREFILQYHSLKAYAADEYEIYQSEPAPTSGAI